MAYETLICEPGAVVRVILNRPEALNAQSRQLLRELNDALHTASQDPDVRVIVLSGRGRAFSAGHDPTEMSAPDRDRQRGYESISPPTNGPAWPTPKTTRPGATSPRPRSR